MVTDRQTDRQTDRGTSPPVEASLRDGLIKHSNPRRPRPFKEIPLCWFLSVIAMLRLLGSLPSPLPWQPVVRKVRPTSWYPGTHTVIPHYYTIPNCSIIPQAVDFPRRHPALGQRRKIHSLLARHGALRYNDLYQLGMEPIYTLPTS